MITCTVPLRQYRTVPYHPPVLTPDKVLYTSTYARTVRKFPNCPAHSIAGSALFIYRWLFSEAERELLLLPPVSGFSRSFRAVTPKNTSCNTQYSQ